MGNPWDNDQIVSSTPAAAPFGNRPVIQGPPPEPKTTYRSLKPDEVKLHGLNPTHAYQISSQGEIRDLGATAGGADQKQIPVQAASGIQGNLETLRQIEAAIRDLDPHVKGSRPQSIGPGTGFFGDTFTQFNDPSGTGVRADVGKIGATTIHDLSGAAVSATEAPRFQPFVPTVQDRPEVALDKLKKFHNALSAQINEQLHFYSQDNGYMPYKGPQADAFLQGGQVSPPGSPQEPPAAPTETVSGFGLQQHAPSQTAESFRTGLYEGMRSGQIKTSADVQAYQNQFNQSHNTRYAVDLNNADTRRALVAAAKGGRFNVATPIPDISDAPQGVGPSVVRGAADTLTSGLRDKIVAAGDALQNNSPLDYNLERQYAITDRDQHDHFLARLGGQALGGFALPMGEVSSVGNLAAKGAGYGAAYGLGSSRQLSDIPANVAGGAAMGAAVPAVLGKVFKPKVPGVDPLVDPVTGELNQPMNSMSPPQRLQMMRDYGMTKISPGMAGGRTARVLEQGLNNVPGSAGVMEDFNQAASGEVRRVMQGVAQKFGQSKTLNEAGTQLQQGARDYISRFKEVSGKAYNAIPIADTAPASTSSSITTLGDLTSRFQSNPDLAGMMSNPKLKGYMDALQKGGISWKDLKDFRSIIGDKIGEARFSDDPSTRDLRALYGSLSEDMQNTAAANGPRATAAFNRANTLYRQGQQRIDQALVSILGDNGMKSPEAAAAMVQTLTKGGKGSGDLSKLAQIRASTVKSGAWDEIASTLIHLGGQPANSEGRAFNPQTFVNWYADMSEPARAMLFRPEQRKALDGFVSIAQQLSRVKGLSNTSNTTPTMIGSGVVAAGGLAAISHPMALLGLAGGGAVNYGMAKLWTNPTFVNLITGYGKAALRGNPNAVQSQVGRLAKFAATNPEFSEPVQSILRQIANDNTVPKLAASPNADQKQQQQ